MKTIGVIGGDRRQAMLAELLAKKGFDVCTYGVNDWSCRERSLAEALEAEVVVLPLPLCWQEGVLNCEGEQIRTRDLFALMKKGTLVLAGQVKAAQMQEAQDTGVRLEDYFLREEMTVANAAATAEAALQVAMEHLDRTLLGMDCLVLGFGRIGKLLAGRLHGLGGRVTVAARKPETLAWIEACGWKALQINALAGELSGFPVVFNTVPAQVVEEELLSELPERCLFVDLASVPGADEAEARKVGIHYIWARGLPGKLVPASAAEAICRAVCGMIVEWEERALRKERIGFAMCGSFCTHREVLEALETLVGEYETVIPIVSELTGETDTRFGSAEELLRQIRQLTGREPLRGIPEVEPIGPKGLLDVLVIAPATGNTIAKLASGITDTAVTMAAKAHLRNGRPVVIAVASNDGLAAGARNIGELLVRKQYYFVPFGQDEPAGKPTSLIADFKKLPETVDAALRGEQIQPLLLRE